MNRKSPSEKDLPAGTAGSLRPVPVEFRVFGFGAFWVWGLEFRVFGFGIDPSLSLLPVSGTGQESGAGHASQFDVRCYIS